MAKGKLTINLTKYNFKPGEYVEGTLSLKINKDVEADEFTVRLKAVERVRSGMGSNRSTRTVNIFDFSQPVGKPGPYKTSPEPMVIPFRILIPADVLNKNKMPEGGLGTALKIAQMALGSRQGRIRWTLFARLKIPGWFNDIKKTVMINVG